MVTIFPLSQLALMVMAIKHGRQFAVWSGVESGDGEWTWKEWRVKWCVVSGDWGLRGPWGLESGEWRVKNEE